MKFAVVWDEWTGSVWMRRTSDALEHQQAEQLYGALERSVDGKQFTCRNLCLQEKW
jgi:hypothetical protein